MHMCLVSKDLGYHALLFQYVTLFMFRTFKNTILKTSIVPRIMLYTLQLFLGVFLLIKQLRNLHLLWIFWKFLPNIAMHPSFPGWTWQDCDWGQCSYLVIPLIGLCKTYEDSDCASKLSAAGQREIWSSPSGRFWWEMLMGMSSFVP